MSYTLRPYQQKIVDILLFNADNALEQLATGGGKTYVFCAFIDLLIKSGYTKKIIISVHREELLHQTCDTFASMDIIPQKVMGGVNRIDHSKQVIVSMSKTLENRYKKDPNFIQNVGIAIFDEAHYLHYTNLLEGFEGVRLIGFTATPVSMKKGFKLSDIFHTMHQSIEITTLIEQGSLVQDVCYHLPLGLEDFKKLKKSDSNGGFTRASLNAVFNKGLLIEQMYEYYEKYSLGKKTMIYCASTSHMEATCEYLVSKGVNARSYGSKSNTGRKEIVRWLRENEDAVLVSLEVFTTGLDVKDIRTIILFRSTSSLALYLQMIGRGGRPTTEVYKDHFVVIDLGNNIMNFGMWSRNRDWDDMFHNRKLSKSDGIAPVRECPKCGRLNHASTPECDECGHVFPKNTVEYIEPDEIKVVKVTGFVAPVVQVQKVWDWCMNQGYRAHKTIYELLKIHIRVLNIHDINKRRYRKESNEILKRIWKAFKLDYVKMSDISHGVISKRIDPNFWGKALIDEVNNYYGGKPVEVIKEKQE